MFLFPAIGRFAKIVALGLTCLGISSFSAYAACNSPAGQKGDIVFNSDHAVMQYCDDTDWVAMGQIESAGAYYNVNFPNCSTNNDGPFVEPKSYDTSGTAQGAWSDGTYVYVADGASGVHAFSLAGPNLTSPVTYNTPGTAVKVWGDGTYIYVADAASGVHALSFNGTAWTLLATYDSPGTANYVTGNGTHIFVSDAASGVHALTFNGTSWSSPITYDTPGTAMSVWWTGTHVLVADLASGVRALSFNGTAWTSVATLTGVGNATALWGDGTYIYLARGTSTGAAAFTFNGTSFSTPVYTPALVGNARSVSGDGTYVYLARDTSGITALTFNGTTWTDVSTLGMGGSVLFLTAADSNLYVAFAGGISVIDFDGTLWNAPLQHASSSSNAPIWGKRSLTGIDVFTAGNALKHFKLDNNGYLTATPTTFGGGVQWTGIWSDENYVYATHSYLGSAYLRVFGLVSGSWTALATDTISGDMGDVWGDGTYIYVKSSLGLRAYTFDGTNLSTAISHPGYDHFTGDGTYIYTEGTATGEILALEFDGTTWSQVGSIILSPSIIQIWDMYAANGLIYVSSGSYIYALTFDGTSFTQLGNYSFGGSNSIRNLWSDGRNLYGTVFSSVSTLYALHFDGTSWNIVDTFIDASIAGVWGDGKHIYTGYTGYLKVYRGLECTDPDNVGGGAAGCTLPAAVAGQMAYNDDHSVMQFCNGNSWVAMGPLGTGGAGCINPGGIAGDMIYNDDYAVMQYCNGTDWVGIGKDFTPDDCSLDGQDVAHGASHTFYSATSHANCASISQSRTCSDGVLDGSGTYQYASCSLVDTTPDAFSFTDQTDVALSTLTTSNIVQITGITSSAATSIAGGSGEYRTCSDAACASVVTNWTSGAATINNNQYVQLRLTSSASNSTAITTTMTVGTVSASAWSVTTSADCLTGPPGSMCADGQSFFVSTASGVRYYARLASTGIQIKTTNTGTAGTTDALNGTSNTNIMIAAGAGTHPAAELCRSYGAQWYVPARNESSSVLSSSVLAALGISTSVDYWTSTQVPVDAFLNYTRRPSPDVYSEVSKTVLKPLLCISSDQDTTPNAFSFTDQTGVATSTLTMSDIVQITGITGNVATSISGSSAEYRICSNADCSSVVTTWRTTATTISNNQYVQLRLTSSASNSTAVTTTMTVGTVSAAAWSVTTEAAANVFTTNFSEYSTGSAPPDWTILGVSGSIVAAPGTIGGKAFRLNSGAMGAAGWDDVPDAADMEMIAVVKSSTNTAGGISGPTGRFDPVGGTGYSGGLWGNSSAASRGNFILRNTTTVNSQISDWAADTYYVIRFQVEGNNLRMKRWLYGDAEPGAWSVTTTDATYTAAAKAGVAKGPTTATSDFQYFSVGINGASPVPPPDITPNSFSFTNQTGVAVSTLTLSNIVQISGLDTAAATSITGGGSRQYRVCADSACSSVVTNWTSSASTISNNQYLQLRITSSGALNTPVTATMTVGTLTASAWTVTTTNTCAGTVSGGYCWYYGGNNQSCTTVCSTHGGYNSATEDYAGTNGSNANCQAVMAALSAPTTTWGGTEANAYGCYYTAAGAGSLRRSSGWPTSAGSAASGIYRACACNG